MLYPARKNTDDKVTYLNRPSRPLQRKTRSLKNIFAIQKLRGRRMKDKPFVFFTTLRNFAQQNEMK